MWWLLASLACSPPAEPPSPEVAPAPSVEVVPVPASGAPVVVRDHAGEVQQYLAALARVDRLIAAQPEAYTAHTERAELLMTLSRLRGGTDDLRAAEAAIERAWVHGADKPATRRAKANLLQKSHRFREALELLEGLDAPADRAFAASLRFELGHYEEAVDTLSALVEGQRFPDPGIAGRLAVCAWKLGRFEEAEAALGIAQAQYRGRDRWVRAWHHLLLGLMDLDRDRLDDAMAHYADAEASFPGWWLVREHVAEIHLLQGRAEEALPIYMAVVAETGSPELMIALADTLDALGRGDEAAAERARALAAFEQQLAVDPAGAGGHALDAFLDHGDPARALELARANVALRPNGESKLQLARALELTGDEAGAAALRAEVEASGWWVPASR